MTTAMRKILEIAIQNGVVYNDDQYCLGANIRNWHYLTNKKEQKDLEFDYFIEEDLNHGYLVQGGNWTGLSGSLVDFSRKYGHLGKSLNDAELAGPKLRCMA
jgi:hypothetical protein